jgi:hypothetical protein
VRRYGRQTFLQRESASKVSTATRGGDAFCMRLTENHRFCSSGFETHIQGGYCWWRAFSSARKVLAASTTSQVFDPKEAFAKFCRKAQVPKASKRRQRTADRTEARGTVCAKVRSQRHRADDRAKVVALMPARCSASLECQKVTLYYNSLDYPLTMHSIGEVGS